MQTIVVTEKETDKLICMLPLESGKRSTINKDYAVELYNDVIPILSLKNGTAYINRNNVIINPEGDRGHEKEN